MITYSCAPRKSLLRALSNSIVNFWRKWRAGLLLLLLLPTPLQASSDLPYYFLHPLPRPALFQPVGGGFAIVRGWDGTSVFNVGDSANTAIRVNCIVGCGGGGTVTANQGTAAATTAGWPIIQGTVATVTAAWTSATPVDTTLVINTAGYGAVLATYNRTVGTITAGTLNFEIADDNTNWHPLQCYLVDFNVYSATSSMNGVALEAIQCDINGATQFRIRLNPVITGTGQANIRITATKDAQTRVIQSAISTWLGSSAPTVGQKTMANSLPVAIASDQSAVPVSGTVTANQGTANATPWNENLAQVAGTAIVTAAAGVQKVGVVGNANAAFDAANNAAMPANALALGGQTQTIDTSPTAATAGNLRYVALSTEGIAYVQPGGPKRFSCFVQAVTVTTQCQAAPAAGLRAYVTSAHMSNQAATVQTLDIVFGTGTNCATGTTALTHKMQFGTNGTTTSPIDLHMSFDTPLVPTAANAICVRPSAATAFGATLTGFIAP